MKQAIAGWLAVLAALVPGELLLAHHSLANHDTTKAVRVKGTIVRVHYINPHSFIYLEEQTAEGQIRRWAIEGPAVIQLDRRGFAKDVLKVGAAIEACGYQPKEPVVWQIASANPSDVSLSGRLLTGEVLWLADGTEQSWGDYGFHKCFPPGYTDQHSR
jgi:hypothetical protein